MTSDATQSPISIWCLLDGKAGHESQILGLAEAIARHRDVSRHEIPVHQFRGAQRLFSRELLALGRRLSTPTLVVGAGHATHVPLIRLRRRFGGLSIVLMKPSLPMSWFDLCLVPSVHDLSRPPANVVLTTGVLNRMLPSQHMRQDRGIVLLGGPSATHDWSDDIVCRQLAAIVARTPDVQFTITTSRRTPDSCVAALSTRLPDCQVVQFDAVSREWLPRQIAECRTAWVTEDSVSMTFEAATAGVAVGLLELPRRRSNRVTQAVDDLVNAHRATRFNDWLGGAALQSGEHLMEADRCARIVIRRIDEADHATHSTKAA